MSINVEGLSINALQANNWSSQKCRPKAILMKYNNDN